MKTKPKSSLYTKYHSLGVVCAVAVVLQFGVLAGFAQTGRYLYTGSETTITLPPGTYNITAYGAMGGSATGIGGALGGEVGAQFNFASAVNLTLLVGGTGTASSHGGGGGGGSFVVNGSTPLVVAGGGGAGGNNTAGTAGGGGTGGGGGGGGGGNAGASNGSSGVGGGGGGGGSAYSGYSGGAGGTGGGGGTGAGSSGGAGGGGGFSSSGGNGDSSGGGKSFLNGGTGGTGGTGTGQAVGGYGGGGGGYDGGGGGGGYSGGGGGGSAGGGGGGGSIIDASAIINLAEVSGVASPDDSPNGEIIISDMTPPSITNQPVSLIASIGGSATFTVGASGVLPPYYQWFYNGGPLAGQTNGTLTLTGVTTSNNGTYSVIVTNLAGSVTSSVVSLTAVTFATDANINSIWTAANSPYLVTSNLVATNLTIQPGVSVLFNGPCSLTVTGLLQAVGTSNNPITFAPMANSGGWQGIYFSSANTNSTMSWCQITGATNGALRFTNTPFVLNNCTIASNFGPLGGGIYTDSALALTNCSILNNTALTADTNSPYSAHGGGIYVTNGPLTLQSCVISNNAMGSDLAYGGGIDCESGNLSLNNCLVISNSVSGDPQANWNDLVTNWMQTTSPNQQNWQNVVSSADGTKLVAVYDTYNGPFVGFLVGIYVSTNSGNSWTPTSSPSTNSLRLALSADGTRLAAAVNPGGIYISTNLGNSWSQAIAPSTNWLSVVSSANGTRLAALVSGGGIYTSTNSGGSWNQTMAPITNWSSIASSADGTKLAATVNGGGIYTSTNSGAFWDQTSAPITNWSAIASSADGKKLAGVVYGGSFTSGGGIYTSMDSGSSWTQTGAPITNWLCIASSADGTKLTAGMDHFVGIYTSANSGATWTLTTAPVEPCYSIASSADGTKLAAVFGNYTGTIYAAKAAVQNGLTAFGGGVFLKNSLSLIAASDCYFNGNQAFGEGAAAFGGGGAIASAQATLLNCAFSGNQATNGGALYLSGNGPLALTNCLLAANQAMAGGAFYSTNSTAVEIVENSTIVSNVPDGLNGFGGSIHDSILFFNSTNQIVNGSPVVTYSDVQGGHTGTGNLNLNPQFADATNYLLSASSPAIDAGDPTTQYFDLSFPPSLGGDRNDMGAYGGPYASLWANLTTNLPVVLVNGQPAAPLQTFSYPNTTPPTISFTNGFPGGSFEYTLDGSDPLDYSTFTTVPFTLTQSAVVRVIAYPADYSSYRIAAPVTVAVLPDCSFTAGTAGGGSVSPASGALLSNSVVLLTASNAPGWTFLNWAGDASGTNNPLSLTLNGSKNVQAVFGTPLSATPSGSGSVATNPVLPAYPYGSTVRLFGVPSSSNNYFRFWGGAAAGNTFSPLDFVVTNASPSITAVFGVLSGGNYSLTLLTSGPGSVSRNPQSSFYANGSVVALTATPNSGCFFTRWSGDAAGTVNPLNVTMNSSKFITANFAATPPVSNSPPSVSITNPVNNAVVTAPTNLTINISASDSDGTVAQVVLFANTNQLAVLTNGNFNYVWTNASIGTNILTAIATDNGGLSTTSAPVTVIVQPSLPQVALSSPTNNASFLTNATIPINAIASDADNALVRVELYELAATNNSQPVLLSSINSPSPQYSFNWATAAVGAYALTARAYDSYGLIVTSTPVNISVMVSPSTNPPVFVFSATNYSVNESNGSVTITVLNNGDLGGLVNYATADGTAFGGSGYSGSYTTAQGPLTFAAGQHSTNISIGIRDNFINGADIHFSVQLFNPSAGVLGTPATTTVTIHQNDAGGATNSLLTTASPTAQPAANGQLTVVLTPAAANGQWRFPWDLAWRNSGTTASNLVADNYPVQFSPVSGYVAIPLAGPVAVTNGGPTTITNQYLPGLTTTDTNGTGSITVKMVPNSPPGDGWRFIGETAWRAPGSTASSLLPDTYYIEFAPVSGYATPGREGVTAVAGQGEVLTVNYQLASSPPGGAALPTPVLSSLIPQVQSYPFGFNGQLHTDAGYGSGAAVRETVVLSAAHMVFNDDTLSYVQQAYWSFEEEVGIFEPEPLAVRGWYVLSGYAIERTNDLQTGGYAVDQSSPQSREEDVAALYFVTPAARGGFGGYLASDAVPNPYLTGNSLKMLVGYPVDGSAFGQTVQSGTMYVTPSQGAPNILTQNSNDVYTGSWFLSYPGNSGGPFYVQFNNSYYYPAGVYLGTLGSGSSSVSLVRAITSDVVNLINLASSEGDAGTNNTGGGVLTLIAGQGLNAAQPAYVQVSLGPPAAVQAGGGWRVQGDGTYGSAPSYTRTVTTNGAKLEFKPLSGWNPPVGQTVQLVAGALTIISNQLYTMQSPRVALDKVNGLRVTGPVGVSYRIDARTNLHTGQWLALQTNILGAGFTPVLPWPPTNSSAAYYRAVLLP